MHGILGGNRLRNQARFSSFVDRGTIIILAGGDTVEQKYVGFKIGTQEYGLDISQVREIIRHQTVTRLPGGPAYLAGIINLRGKVLPVLELAALLGVESAGGDDRRAIVADSGGSGVGLIVDEVTEVFTLSDDCIEDPRSFSSNSGGLITGVGKRGDRLIIILDSARICRQCAPSLLDEAG